MAIALGRIPESLLPGAPPERCGPTVLQVNGTYLPIGESWIYEQAKNVESHRIVIAARAWMNLDAFPFDPIYSIKRCSPPIRLFDATFHRLTGRTPFFARVSRHETAEIMHAHGGRTGAFIVDTARRLKIPLITSFYGADMWADRRGHDSIRRRYADLAGYGARFLVEGPAAKAQLVHLGFAADRIVIHRLGVDVSNIPFHPRVLGDGKELKILMAARFMNKKGLPYGVEAFSRVARDNPAMRMTIVGKRNSRRDNRIADELFAIARRHGVENRVELKEFVGLKRLTELSAAHHLLLQPSVTTSTGDAEGGHPVTLTFLAATGMPMLATRHCDIPEIVQHGQTGWLVEERDVDALESALRDILGDPSELTTRGANARALVEEKYDSRQMRLDPVYDGVLSAKGPQAGAAGAPASR